MSAFGDTITKYIPIAGKKPKMEKKDALAVVPVRNPLVEWERKGDEVIITVPLRGDRLAKAVRKVVNATSRKDLPDTRQIGLDEVGSFVWELCDGERNIDSIVQSLSSKHKLTRREAEASVTVFLQTLAKKNLIGLMSVGGKNVAKRKK